MQLQHAVGLAEIAVGVIDVFHRKAGVVLAAHGVVIGATDQVRDRGGDLHHLVGLSDVIHPLGGNQQRALVTAEQGVQQQGLELVAAQVIEDLRHPKAQERFVLQGLNGPLLHLPQELLRDLR
ncbi:hypothetical protein D3C76_1316250 [compost metagenome]